MEQVPVGTRSYFINDIGFEIYIDGTGDVFSLTCGDILSISTEPRDGIVILKVRNGSRVDFRDIPVSEKKVLNPWSWGPF